MLPFQARLYLHMAHSLNLNLADCLFVQILAHTQQIHSHTHTEAYAGHMRVLSAVAVAFCLRHPHWSTIPSGAPGQAQSMHSERGSWASGVREGGVGRCGLQQWPPGKNNVGK